jgi:hypothetical protein
VWVLAEPVVVEQVDRSLAELARVAVVAVAPARGAERAERGYELWMVHAERSFLDDQCKPQAPLGGAEVAALGADRSEAAERCGREADTSNGARYGAVAEVASGVSLCQLRRAAPFWQGGAVWPR